MDRNKEEFAAWVAEVCHEANRVMTDLVADVPVQPAWDAAPQEMRDSAVKGVLFAIDNPDATPEQQHEAWMKDKLEQGWVWGARKDSEAKFHPALKPYVELSAGTRAKDALFRAIVKAMAFGVSRAAL